MDKALSLAVQQYLEQLDGGSAAAECVAKATGVSVSDDTDAHGIEVGLDKVFEAGLESLGVSPGSAAAPSATQANPEVEALLKLPKFQKYLTVLEGKGFFEGVEKGSKEYDERLTKVVASYKKKFGDAPAPVAAAAADTDAETKEADAFKAQGNKFLQERDFENAVESYTKAINTSPAGPSSHLYYSNRAAAYQHLKNYEAALEDCSVATTLMPDYAKAHARAAQANLSLGRKDDAKECATRTLELDPNNAGATVILRQLGASGAVSSGGAGGAGGMPDMAGLAGMMQGLDPSVLAQAQAAMGGAGAGAGAGGMPDIASMMNNPQMMAAAQSMMQNPAMRKMAEDMAKDPNAMSNLMNMMGGPK